jgi:hypothetical protein
MSAEHQPIPSQSHERTASELEAMRRSQLEQLATTPEDASEQAKNRAKEAREVIEQHKDQPEPATEAESAPARRPTIAAHLDQAISYTQTLASLQRRLQPASRTFSKIIHTPAIERTSEFLERTALRPSIITGATWTAAIVGLIFYVTARSNGYPLSGTEMLAALAGGAVLGLVAEGLFRLFRRR